MTGTLLVELSAVYEVKDVLSKPKFGFFVRVMVLDKGEIKEFGSPQELLADAQSTFFSMAKDAGLSLANNRNR